MQAKVNEFRLYSLAWIRKVGSYIYIYIYFFKGIYVLVITEYNNIIPMLNPTREIKDDIIILSKFITINLV